MSLRARRARRAAGAPQFNFAPMVDVVLLLLVFFMTATTLGPAPRGLPVSLPTAASASASATRLLEVSLAADGRIGLGERQGLSPAALEAALREMMPGTDGAVSLRADRAARHGRVVEVMDAIKRAGAKRLSILARPD